MIDFIRQIPPYTVYRPVFETNAIQCHLRVYSPHSQFKVVIFSKMGDLTSRFTVDEVKHLVNLLVQDFGLDPQFVAWIEYYLPEKKKLFDPTFSLYTFDWHNGQATNPKSCPVFEEWYLSWVENGSIEYFFTLNKTNTFKDFCQ